MGDYYNVLGVKQTANAAEIRDAYLSRLRQWQPNKQTAATDPSAGGMAAARNARRAQAMLAAAKEAYAALGDTQTRAAYDRSMLNENNGDTVASAAEPELSQPQTTTSTSADKPTRTSRNSTGAINMPLPKMGVSLRKMLQRVPSSTDVVGGRDTQQRLRLQQVNEGEIDQVDASVLREDNHQGQNQRGQEVGDPQAVALKHAGNVAFQHDDYAGSVKCFSDAIAIVTRGNSPPDQAMMLALLISRSAALASLGNHSASLADADAALQLDPQSERALARKGHALLNSRKIPEALEAFRSALALAPDNETLQQSVMMAERLMVHIIASPKPPHAHLVKAPPPLQKAANEPLPPPPQQQQQQQQQLPDDESDMVPAAQLECALTAIREALEPLRNGGKGSTKTALAMAEACESIMVVLAHGGTSQRNFGSSKPTIEMLVLLLRMRNQFPPDSGTARFVIAACKSLVLVSGESKGASQVIASQFVAEAPDLLTIASFSPVHNLRVQRSVVAIVRNLSTGPEGQDEAIRCGVVRFVVEQVTKPDLVLVTNSLACLQNLVHRQAMIQEQCLRLGVPQVVISLVSSIKAQIRDPGAASALTTSMISSANLTEPATAATKPKTLIVTRKMAGTLLRHISAVLQGLTSASPHARAAFRSRTAHLVECVHLLLDLEFVTDCCAGNPVADTDGTGTGESKPGEMESKKCTCPSRTKASALPETIIAHAVGMVQNLVSHVDETPNGDGRDRFGVLEFRSQIVSDGIALALAQHIVRVNTSSHCDHPQCPGGNMIAWACTALSDLCKGNPLVTQDIALDSPLVPALVALAGRKCESGLSAARLLKHMMQAFPMLHKQLRQGNHGA